MLMLGDGCVIVDHRLRRDYIPYNIQQQREQHWSTRRNVNGKPRWFLLSR